MNLLPEEKSKLVNMVENSDINKNSLRVKDYILLGVSYLTIIGCAATLYWFAKEFIEAASHYD